MLSRIPLEPLAWGHCVCGFGYGLRIALNLAPIHHEKKRLRQMPQALFVCKL
jgi:hypothetical protein